MENKYKLLNETKIYLGSTLHRIQALKDFRDVKAGDLGGWVEGEWNLSQDGLCWLYDDAAVWGKSKVYENALAFDYSRIFGNSRVFGDAKTYGSSRIFDCASIWGHAKTYDYCGILGGSTIAGNALISGNVIIGNNAIVENASIYGNAKIGENAHISNTSYYFSIDNIGSRHDTVTFYLDKERNIWVNTGCFNDTLEAFKRKVTETHKENYFAKEYFKAIELAEYKFKYGKIN